MLQRAHGKAAALNTIMHAQHTARCNAANQSVKVVATPLNCYSCGCCYVLFRWSVGVSVAQSKCCSTSQYQRWKHLVRAENTEDDVQVIDTLAFSLLKQLKTEFRALSATPASSQLSVTSTCGKQ